MGAPLNPVANVLKVVLTGFIDDSASEVEWANILHFTYGGTAPSSATCSSIAASIGTQWAAHVASLCPSPTSLQKVTVTDLTSDTAGSGEDFTIHAGSRGDDSIPANAALLISYPVSSRYKGGHPRTYLYVLGNADLEGAFNWSTAATAEVQTAWRTFLGACLSTGGGGTVLSSFCAVRYRGKFLPNSGPPHFYLDDPIVIPINSGLSVARQQMASQRGRIERRKA